MVNIPETFPMETETFDRELLKNQRISKGIRELQEPGTVSDQIRRSHVVQILPAPPRPSQARRLSYGARPSCLSDDGRQDGVRVRVLGPVEEPATAMVRVACQVNAKLRQ